MSIEKKNEVVVSPDDLGQLLAETNFTKREILEFYKYSSPDGEASISKREFGQLCFENGIKNPAIVNRIWKLWDINGDGNLSHFELVKGLNPILRGDKREVASFFYDLYDIDGNADLTSPEVIAVYSDLLHASQGNDSQGLSSEQKQRLREWVKANQDENGKLTKEVFVEAVLEMCPEHAKQKAALLSCRTAFYLFLTAWFEMGTSFSLPAMGALSDRIKERFDINDEGIGTLTSAYFFAAMVGPLAGGYAMDKLGPGIVVIFANLFVLVGAVLQATAKGASQFWLILIGRLLLGFGGEITPFTTIEILGRLFPDYFGLMAGIRNLIQSLSGFLAFVLLPIWADAIHDDDNNPDKGTSFALWMCAVLAVVSLLTSTIVYVSMKKEQLTDAPPAEETSDQQTITKTIRMFAKATAPQIPTCQRWMMPLSFFLACFGIKAQYFAPFGFTAFSNKIYKEKFGQSRSVASFLSGFISLLAGLMSPFMGHLSDKIGKRSLCLAFGSLFSVIGFAILATSGGFYENDDNDGDDESNDDRMGKLVVWLASVLFALQYGFGDTVAYISIRFIVGVSRSGLGYGIYGVVGNLIATLVPMIGGFLMESSSGIDKVLWYFTGLMGFGTLCWILVFVLEGPRSLLELPADQVIETCDEDLKLAALSYVASPIKTTAPKTPHQKRGVPNDDDDDDDDCNHQLEVSTDSHHSHTSK